MKGATLPCCGVWQGVTFCHDRGNSFFPRGSVGFPLATIASSLYALSVAFLWYKAFLSDLTHVTIVQSRALAHGQCASFGRFKSASRFR